MPNVHVRGINIYYEVHTPSPLPESMAPPQRVVLISGTGGDLRANPLRGRGLLETTFEVLMYDQRGLGQTDKPDDPYTMADYADDCVALMDALGWDTAHVMGISFGGMVAQHVALRYPTRVNKLVLACTSSGGLGGDSFDLLAVHDLPTKDRIEITAPIMDTRNDLTTDPPTLAPFFDALLPIMLSGNALNSDDPSAAIGARRQLEARAEHNTWDQLKLIGAHTFVIGGTFDMQAPPENVRRLAAEIANSTIEFFDGGHMFLLQDPLAWPAIVEFLR
jgi:3-oxoadipate enol-lactonase